MAGGVRKWLNGTLNKALASMIDHRVESKRQERLDSWYEQDGRSDKSHPMYALYTGLAEKYAQKEQENA
jgi:hypothetical protein